jgi:iron(III) transport system substrate-binding protein
LKSLSPQKFRKLALSLLAVTSVCVAAGCGGSATKTAAPTQEKTTSPQSGVEKQGNGASAVQQVAMYEGADREQKLVDAAKKEGKLTLYTSMAADDMQKIATSFEQKYGIKVNVWRASSENVLQRAVTEAKAGKFDFDVVETNGPELEAMHREKLLQEVKSPYLKDLIPEAILPHKEWVATRLNIFVQAYNTQKVKKEELPKNYEDLLDPKWKGRIGIEESDIDWLATVTKDMGEDKGIKLFKDVVAQNGVSVRKGHTLLTQMVASGEVPLALTVYNYKSEQMKKDGAPIDWFAIEPAIARPNGEGVAKNAPHPSAAVLFFDYMLNDAQAMLAKSEFVPTNKKIDTNLNKMKMKFADPAATLDENDKWTKIYDETFIKKTAK